MIWFSHHLFARYDPSAEPDCFVHAYQKQLGRNEHMKSGVFFCLFC